MILRPYPPTPFPTTHVLMDPTLNAYLLGACSAFLVGLSKTGVPGVSLPAILLITMAFSGADKMSVGAILPVLVVGDLMGVAFYREHVQWNKLWGLFPTVIAGMIPGIIVLATIDHNQFKLVLGWMVFALLLLEICRQAFGWDELPEKWWFVATMGLLAGFSTLIGNAAGPVMAIYLISRGLGKNHFMGTWVWFFLIVNVLKIPIVGSLGLMNLSTLQFSLIITPGVVLGALLGKRVFTWIPQKVFDPLVLTLAGVAAFRLITG